MKIDHGRNNGHSGLFFLLMFLMQSLQIQRLTGSFSSFRLTVTAILCRFRSLILFMAAPA